APRAGALLAGAGRPVPAEPGADRRRRQAHAGRRAALMDPRITPLLMPKWGLEMREGTIAGWLVDEGTRLEVGMPVVDVETDKISNAVEAPDPGLLRRKVAKDGETLPVKALLAVLAEADVPDADIDAYVAAYEVPAAGDEDETSGPAYDWVE